MLSGYPGPGLQPSLSAALNVSPWESLWLSFNKPPLFSASLSHAPFFKKSTGFNLAAQAKRFFDLYSREWPVFF